MKRSISVYHLAMIFLALATFGVTLIAVIPKWRTEVRLWVHGDDREILAFVDGDLKNDSTQLRIYKIKNSRGLFLEIYTISESGFSGDHIKTITLPDTKDGYFNFMGKPTNLAITDVDNDGSFEIIAPSYDENLIARLNVYHYNKEKKEFERITPQQLGFQ